MILVPYFLLTEVAKVVDFVLTAISFPIQRLALDCHKVVPRVAGNDFSKDYGSPVSTRNLEPDFKTPSKVPMKVSGLYVISLSLSNEQSNFIDNSDSVKPTHLTFSGINYHDYFYFNDLAVLQSFILIKVVNKVHWLGNNFNAVLVDCITDHQQDYLGIVLITIDNVLFVHCIGLVRSKTN